MLRAFTSRACLRHAVPHGFPELPARLAGITARLAQEGIEIEEVEPSTGGAAWRAVSALHCEDYLARFQRAVERGDGLLDSADNPLSPGTWEAAWAAVSAALEACDWVLGDAGRRALVAARPPGHHAERDMAMGFCYLGTAAVAAQHLVEAHGLDRVAIFDFDVHHGNGTQHLLEERGDVLYVSTHQWPFYPGTGAAGETGRGAGLGATLNVPLAAGCGDAEYQRALDGVVLPALERFEPQALVLSAGFDAWRRDPLGGMRVTLHGFESWGRRLGTFADECCGGRVVAVLEGGYDLDALPGLVVAHMKALDGGR
jgi:acetoin utilization deacetylase AcuC-like enzyme